MASTKYQVGDIVFFITSSNTVAGEEMFIGRVKGSPDDLVGYSSIAEGGAPGALR